MSSETLSPEKLEAQQRELVTLCAAAGLTLEQGADVVQVPRKVIQRKFRKEWQAGLSKANAKVAASLFNKAVGGNVTACIFWLKCRGGVSWREPEAGSGVKLPFGGDGKVEVHYHLPASHPRLVDAVRALPAPGPGTPP